MQSRRARERHAVVTSRCLPAVDVLKRRIPEELDGDLVLFIGRIDGRSVRFKRRVNGYFSAFGSDGSGVGSAACCCTCCCSRVTTAAAVGGAVSCEACASSPAARSSSSLAYWRRRSLSGPSKEVPAKRLARFANSLEADACANNSDDSPISSPLPDRMLRRRVRKVASHLRLGPVAT